MPTSRCGHLFLLWNANSALNKHSHIFCALLLSHWNPQHSSHLNFVSMPGHLIGDFAVCKWQIRPITLCSKRTNFMTLQLQLSLILSIQSIDKNVSQLIHAIGQQHACRSKVSQHCIMATSCLPAWQGRDIGMHQPCVEIWLEFTLF